MTTNAMEIRPFPCRNYMERGKEWVVCFTGLACVRNGGRYQRLLPLKESNYQAGPAKRISARPARLESVVGSADAYPPADRRNLFLLCYLAKRNANSLGYTFAVGRIGLQAVADMAYLDLFRRIGNGTGGVFEEEFLFFRAYEAEEQAGLGVVVVIVFAESSSGRRHPSVSAAAQRILAAPAIHHSCWARSPGCCRNCHQPAWRRHGESCGTGSGEH